MSNDGKTREQIQADITRLGDPTVPPEVKETITCDLLHPADKATPAALIAAGTLAADLKKSKTPEAEKTLEILGTVAHRCGKNEKPEEN